MRSFLKNRGALWGVLQNSDFRIIWYMGALGEFCRSIEMFVFSWMILELTDSYIQLLLVPAFNNLPRLMISMWAGYIAERSPRARILLTAQTINVLTTTILLSVIVYNFDLIEPWQVFAAMFIQGVTRSIEDPSRRTSILDIVGQRRLVNALSLEVISNNLSRMTGPIIGAILVATAGFIGTYVFLLTVHVFNLALMTRLRIPDFQGPAQVESIVRSLRLVVGYARRSSVLLGLFYITFVMNVLAFPIQQFVPAIGRDHLGVGVTLVGLLVAANGFGQLAGAGIMSISRDLRYHGRIFVLGSIGILVVSGIFVWSPWYLLTFGFLTMSGIAHSYFSTMQNSVTMLATFHHMRGRMLGLLSTCIGAGMSLGALLIGLIVSAFSIQWTISLNSLAGLLLIVPAIVFTPLPWQTVSQIVEDSHSVAEPDDEEA